MAASGRLQQFEQYRKVITNGKWNGKTALVPHILEQPLHWREPRMIFVESMGDLFLAPFEQIDKVISVIQRANWHKYQILTKRIDRVLPYIKSHDEDTQQYVLQRRFMLKHPYPNLWLGVTVEAPLYKHRIVTLSRIPAAVRFVSLEPLLEDIDFDKPYLGYITTILEGIDWVIVGCESGPGRRPCKLEWVRNIVSQCRAAGVAVFVKQLSISNKVIHDIEQFPEDLQIQEYPK